MIIGAQLFSVRVKCGNEADIKETFGALAAMGYKSIQVSGFTYDAEYVRSVADEYGLHIGLTHTPVDEIINNTEEVIRKHKVLGADVVGVGGAFGIYMKDGKILIDNFINDISPAVEKIEAAGLKFAFHNHAKEFEDYGGYNIMDKLFETTNWNFTFDTGWAHYAGTDVLSLIEKYKDRLEYVHLKDFRPATEEEKNPSNLIAPLYCGNVPVDEIIKKLIEVGTVKVAYVEQDNASAAEDPIGEMQKSIDGLKAHGWV